MPNCFVMEKWAVSLILSLLFSKKRFQWIKESVFRRLLHFCTSLRKRCIKASPLQRSLVIHLIAALTDFPFAVGIGISLSDWLKIPEFYLYLHYRKEVSTL